MDNRVRSARFAAAVVLTVLMLFVCAAASADADPIRVSSLSEPQSVISEQDVSITIKVYNSSQTDIQGDIFLYSPNGGVPIETYSGLKGEQSVTYNGAWRVTKDQIEKGKINYFIKYTVDTGDGANELTRTIPVTIQSEAAAPQLTATYSVSPTSAREGQEVALSYTLSNTGNVELRNIVIENEGISKEKLSQPSLSVGEKVTITDSFTMGTKELVSKPSITYQAADSKKELTISDMARKTITVAEDGLEVALSAENTEKVYPGERITIKLTMKNTGEAAYTGLSAQLSDGTSIASGVELASGASFEQEIEWAAKEDAALTAAVSGKDDDGEAVSVVSNELAVTTQDASRALVLNIAADVETDTIHSEPAVLRFGVVVENIGQTDAANLSILQGGTIVAKIPSLPSGESRTVVFDLETSIAGKFQFVVTGKDFDGNEKAYESNILQVNYVAPTPAPTAVPTPSPVPPTPSPAPTATPAPTLGKLISQKVNPVVLYTAAGLLAAAIVAVLAVSGVSSARRKKRMEQAIDTIQRSPDVRDHRGARPRRKQAEAKRAEPAARDEAIVPATELTDEEASRMMEDAAQKAEAASATPAKDAMRQFEREEGRRRRAAQEIPNDETLRVVPVDQRPEFIAQGKVDDSETRVFGKLPDELAALKEEPAPKAAPAEPETAPEKKPGPEKKSPAAKKLARKRIEDELPEIEGEEKNAAADETIRLDRTRLDEIRAQEPREDTFKKGQKRSEIKPLKKKKGFLFGRKAKEEEEDDFFEDFEDDLGDDDLFE